MIDNACLSSVCALLHSDGSYDLLDCQQRLCHNNHNNIFSPFLSNADLADDWCSSAATSPAAKIRTFVSKKKRANCPITYLYEEHWSDTIFKSDWLQIYC